MNEAIFTSQTQFVTTMCDTREVLDTKKHKRYKMNRDEKMRSYISLGRKNLKMLCVDYSLSKAEMEKMYATLDRMVNALLTDKVDVMKDDALVVTTLVNKLAQRVFEHYLFGVE